ncbi:MULTISPECIES: condensation domain-containing protein [unclassified Streptomyces]|uniref:condensation domain-containing protein n=1 Tax=unclassified Streptomyces TaxID=2593676 RepID=UPI00331B0F8E
MPVLNAPAGPVPLTFEQERYLAKTRAGGWTTKNVRLSYEILGPFDTELFTEAVRAFVARHDALRLRLAEDGAGGWAQQAHPLVDDETVVERQAVTAASAEQFSRYASALLSRDFVQPWDGERRPFALRLLRRDAGHHAFLANFPNLVFDGRAHQLFASEIWRDYRALLRGEPAACEAPSFAAAALGQRTRTGPLLRERARDSWRERLGEAVRSPWERPSGAVATEDGSCRAELSGPAVEALRAACERERCTPLQRVVAAFVGALAQQAGQRRVALWTSMDSRLTRQQDVVGMFAASCPLVVREPGAAPEAVLGTVRGQLLEALRHQRVTSADVAALTAEAEAGAGRPYGRDIVLHLRRFDGPSGRTAQDGALRITPDAYPLRRITFDNPAALHLRCDEHRDRIVLDLLYDGGRVGRPLARAVLDGLVHGLVRGAAPALRGPRS